jgi:preprotein translocase subunit SecG
MRLTADAVGRTLGYAGPARFAASDQELREMLNVILIAIQVLSALTLIFLILLHSGRGGGLSDMFGGGQLGGSMAGSTVVERNLDRLTVITGTIFMFTTVLLALRLD